MRRDFDFEEVGKKVPYQVPDGFFEDIQRQVLERTCVEKSVVKKATWIRFVPVVSAVAAVMCAVLYLPLREHRVEEGPISQVTVIDDAWIENMSDEDLEMMSDFSDYDMFMNQPEILSNK